jgi:hypothetical protein
MYSQSNDEVGGSGAFGGTINGSTVCRLIKSDIGGKAGTIGFVTNSHT